MSEELRNLLRNWKATTDDRKKLQASYIMLAMIGIVVAGIIALLDAELGQNVAYVALASFVVFLLNAVMWHLVVENAQDKIADAKTTRKK